MTSYGSIASSTGRCGYLCAVGPGIPHSVDGHRNKYMLRIPYSIGPHIKSSLRKTKHDNSKQFEESSQPGHCLTFIKVYRWLWLAWDQDSMAPRHHSRHFIEAVQQYRNVHTTTNSYFKVFVCRLFLIFFFDIYTNNPNKTIRGNPLSPAAGGSLFRISPASPWTLQPFYTLRPGSLA